jgi:hypothetical protein
VNDVTALMVCCLRAASELIKYSVKSNRSSDVWLKKLSGP